jgi:hypothetical protein
LKPNRFKGLQDRFGLDSGACSSKMCADDNLYKKEHIADRSGQTAIAAET